MGPSRQNVGRSRWAVAAVGVGAAFVGTRILGVAPKRAYTAAALGSAVFAAQLFNVQILPFSSVHLIGGVLLAWVLSPALGALTMTGILTLQAVLLGDGGLLALGANIINMGLMPAAAVALVRRGKADCPAADSPWTLALTAFACTVLAAGLIVLEVSVGRSAAQLEGLQYFAARMLAWHALAGVAEAGLTVAIVAVLAKLAARRLRSAWSFRQKRAGLVVAASLAIAVLSLPAFRFGKRRPRTAIRRHWWLPNSRAWPSERSKRRANWPAPRPWCKVCRSAWPPRCPVRKVRWWCWPRFCPA